MDNLATQQALIYYNFAQKNRGSRLDGYVCVVLPISVNAPSGHPEALIIEIYFRFNLPPNARRRCKSPDFVNRIEFVASKPIRLFCFR